MLAEARVNTAHFIATTLLEQILERAKNVRLTIRPGASLIRANDWDRQLSNYRESANDYYSVYTFSEDPERKADALIGLSQELINLQSLRKAREFLNKAPELFQNLPEVKKILFQAQVEGKKGWIEDYELGYWNELKHFGNAVDILNQIPRDKWGNDGEELYSTAKHFSGRARFWMAASGIDKTQNVYNAIELFGEAIDLDESLDVFTKEEKIGHGYAWMARCYLLLKDIPLTENLIGRALYCYGQHEEKVEKSAVMAHWYILRGSKNLQVELLDEAREDFEKAIDIRNRVGQYSQGLAVAYLGLAEVSRREGKLGHWAGYTLKAAKINPLVILRGGIGG